MKFRFLPIIFTITFLTVACTPQTTPTSNNPAANTATPGQFVSDKHPTEGRVEVVSENGQRYLVFDNAFKSDNGPDLFVLLHRGYPPQQYQSQDYVNLGRLQKTDGQQRYAIPADVDISNFQSVVIWCRLFKVTFGYAAL